MSWCVQIVRLPALIVRLAAQCRMEAMAAAHLLMRSVALIWFTAARMVISVIFDMTDAIKVGSYTIIRS